MLATVFDEQWPFSARIHALGLELIERVGIMNTRAILLTSAALIVLTVSPILAQQSNAPDPTIAQRKDNQQDRIAQGLLLFRVTARIPLPPLPLGAKNSGQVGLLRFPGKHFRSF